MEFECDDCGEQFEILSENDKIPTYCPYCSGLITPGWGDEQEDDLWEDDDS
jgi:NAD-dependent SIR2 family protein deacetylase